MTARKIVLMLSVLALVAMTWVVLNRASVQQQGPIQILPSGGDFTLMTADGEISLADLRGEVVLLYFGYTHCPDVCPIDLAIMGQAISNLDPHEQAQARGLFVSVDPERDDLEHLKRYTAHFHERIIGATGTHEAITRAASLYAAGYMADPLPEGASSDAYTISHTASTYVIDREGQLRERLSHASAVDETVAAIRRVLQIPIASGDNSAR